MAHAPTVGHYTITSGVLYLRENAIKNNNRFVENKQQEFK